MNRLVEKALSSLARQPIRSNVLKHLDVLFVEELSMVSSELWAAMDQVLKCLCDSNVPFAGKLIIATGDFNQLPPPSGHSLIASTFIFTTFTSLPLQHFVRMQNLDGRRLLSLLVKSSYTENDKSEIWNLIEQHCLFVDSWSEVPDDCLQVFATRKAEMHAIQNKVNAVRELQQTNVYVTATDEACSTNTEIWKLASNAEMNFLDKVCLEPRQLFLYQGAMLRLTKNLQRSSVFQGQVCKLMRLPDEQNNSVDVIFLPPGSRRMNVPDVDTRR